MATKPLTDLFVSRRAFFKMGRPSAPKLSNENGNRSEAPEWVDALNRAEDVLAGIQSKLKDLHKLQLQRLIVTFGSDEKAQQDKIDELSEEIADDFRSANAVWNEIKLQSEQSTGSEKSVRMNMRSCIEKKIAMLSNNFRQGQNEYITRKKALAGGVDGSSFLTDSSISGAIPLSSSQAPDRGFSDSQMRVLEDLDQLVNDRDLEISRIAKSIQELNQMFSDLAKLVIEQGTILDRIDFNMDQVIENTTEGKKNLDEAEQHQKDSLSIKCIIALVILIAIMTGLLIYKYSGGFDSKKSK